MSYLQHHGLRLVHRNFRCRVGEIDLVMTDDDALVFVEVRFRRNEHYGAGYESVTRSKQRKLMAAARIYLACHDESGTPCRFDVVSVTKRNYQPDFLWIRDAFGQDQP